MRRALITVGTMAIAVVLTACGGGTASNPTPTAVGGGAQNDMSVVAGDEDAVAGDGLELSSRELRTCSEFVTQQNVLVPRLKEAAAGSVGEGWTSNLAGLPRTLQQLQLEVQAATTPEFAAALTASATAGAPVFDAVSAGRAPAEEDYDPAGILAGFEVAAALCERAGVNIVWFE
ncbi:hypothetical protein GIS00_01525 [Nakamurella sp. YIM 132087]|uniref:Lipoprotein n=1 Tax=Nakamurella alba TaxID=2665158 RepID=A0A7K1FIB0_9ACTN|nr:hypothetical protein [Nakamurella alba]MTD12624.1 hypothetical protein [Nakamurella alba]